MLLADAIAVVAVHQHIAPQHQGVAAALGQQAALQSFVLLGGQRVDIGFEVLVDDDVHGGMGGQGRGGIVGARGAVQAGAGRQPGALAVRYRKRVGAARDKVSSHRGPLGPWPITPRAGKP
jgi:hypothetical protein